jgi:hypothetical protein
MCLRCDIEDHLKVLCTCETYFECQWHERLKKEDHAIVLQDMKDELSDRHLAWAIQQGFVDPVEK